MKRNSFKYILAIFFALGFFSCNKDFLEVPILVDQSAETFDPVTAVTACYNITFNGQTNGFPNHRWFNWQGFVMGDCISDDAFKSGSGQEDQPSMRVMELFDTNPGNVQVSNFWRMLYIHIYWFNWTLNGLERNQTITDDLRNRYTGEVLFLRSLNYFWLNRAFGGVVPVFEVVDNYDIARDSEANIYKKIEEDLKQAIDLLPEKSEYSSADLGRATKGAARGLLAKVYLYQQKNQECFDMCKEIIESGEYQLESDFKNIWKLGLPGNERNEQGVESLFEFTFAPNPENSNPNDVIVSMLGRQPELKGWGMVNPTLDLLDDYEVGDPRIVSTFMFEGDSMQSVDGTSNFAIDCAISPSNEHMMLNNKVTRKQADYPEIMANYGYNKIVLRYADILLMYAEAANELGNSAEALAKLNMVRQRARQSDRNDDKRTYINFNGELTGNYVGEPRTYLNYDWWSVADAEILPDIITTSKEELRKIIWHERRVEFAFEGERFYDLARQSRVEPNRIGNTMRAFAEKWHNDKGANFTDGKNELLPIPSNEIDLVGSDLLPQNPNY